MGAERAVTAADHGPDFLSGVILSTFADQIVVKIELDGETKDERWVLFGRVHITNHDADYQEATVKLVHDANVVIDQVTLHMHEKSSNGVTLMAGFVPQGREVITLECSTYDGTAWAGAITAIKVDTLDFQ